MVTSGTRTKTDEKATKSTNSRGLVFFIAVRKTTTKTGAKHGERKKKEGKNKYNSEKLNEIFLQFICWETFRRFFFADGRGKTA